MKTNNLNRRSFLSLTALAGGSLMFGLRPKLRAQNPFADAPLAPKPAALPKTQKPQKRPTSKN